jgi:anaerobic selenocysteine-containing dehydrogenase
MAESAIKKIPFVVNIAYHLDEITQMSDILLVSPSMLESLGHVDYFGAECSMSTGEPGYNTAQTQRLYRNPVPMIYNTREPNNVVIDLCERIGILKELNENLNNNGLIGPRPFSPPLPLKDKYKLSLNRKYTYEEMIDLSFKNVYGDNYGLDYLKEHSFIPTYDLNDAEVYPSYYNDTIRFQLYAHTQLESGDFLLSNLKKHVKDTKSYMGIEFEELAKHYEPVMVYTDNKISNAPEEYNLYAITCRLPMSLFRIGGLDQNPWVLDWNNKYYPMYNSICIHPEEAQRKGIKEGDTVVVESQYGSTKGRCHVTHTVHPRALIVPGATGRMVKSMGEQIANQTCFNKLLTGKLGHISPIHGGIETTARVKVYKA